MYFTHVSGEGNHRLYSSCIGTFDEQRGGKQYRRYNSVFLLEQVHLTKAPQLLQMNLGGLEYDILSDMVQTSPDLLPEQLR